MTPMLLFYILCGAMFVWVLNALIFYNKKVDMIAEVPQKNVGAMAIAAVLALIVFIRFPDDPGKFIVIGGLALDLLLYSFIKSGVGEQGIYTNGRFVPFLSMKYYGFEKGYDETKLRMRFRGRRSEYALLFDPKFQKQIVDIMEKNEVDSWDKYKDIRRAEINRKRNQKAGKKRKK